MKEARYFFVPQANAVNELPVDEASHALRVLRLQVGDEMFLMDGEGVFYKACVSVVSSKRCFYEIQERLPQKKSWGGRLLIAMAPTKMMDRVEWFAEKATEVGIDTFSFLRCRFSERKEMRKDRIEKVVVSAVKQSRKPWKPEVGEMVGFKDFIQQAHQGHKFIAHCYNEIPRVDLFDTLMSSEVQQNQDDIIIMIGPEGDFSVDEVKLAMEHGYQSVTLGSSRLRTETAALSAVMMAQLARRL